MSMRSSRRTDIGTVLVHLVLIVSFVVTLGTGLRIASDDPDAAWLSILDPIPVSYTHLTLPTKA